MEKKKLVVKTEKKLVKAIEKELEIPYNAVVKALRKKDVLVNGKRVAKDVTVNANDVVEIFVQLSEQTFCTEIYADENLLVVDKKPNVTVEKLAEVMAKNGCTPVHRLDRNTSGLLIFAKNERAYEELLNAFKNGKIEKYYLATVYGKMPKNTDTLVAYLKKDAKNSRVFVSDNHADGKIIKTKYSVKKFVDGVIPISELEVQLFTGRTHQIRAHMAHIGHFVIGDGKYGNDQINKTLKVKKQMLTAYKLVFNFEKESFLSYLNDIKITLKADN